MSITLEDSLHLLKKLLLLFFLILHLFDIRLIFFFKAKSLFHSYRCLRPLYTWQPSLFLSRCLQTFELLKLSIPLLLLYFSSHIFVVNSFLLFSHEIVFLTKILLAPTGYVSVIDHFHDDKEDDLPHYKCFHGQDQRRVLQSFLEKAVHHYLLEDQWELSQVDHLLRDVAWWFMLLWIQDRAVVLVYCEPKQEVESSE